MTRDRWGPILLLGLSLLAGCPPSRTASAASRTVTALSEVYTIDRKYETMQGPSKEQSFMLLEADQPELLWIIGGRVEVVHPDGGTPLPLPELVCHSFLRLDHGKLSVEAHSNLFGGATKVLPKDGHFIGFAQGYLVAKLPEGFGMPVLSTEPLILYGMVMNQNLDDLVRFRLRWTMEFVRDQDLQRPLKPFLRRVAFIAVPEPTGQGVRYHWRVPPGREVRRYRIPHEIVPYDTTVHYIRAHLHAFGESVALRDVTTDTTLFTSHATPYPDRLGIAQMDVFSSEAGLPVYQDHEYELVSVYHNTSGSEQVGMVGMSFCLLDNMFQKPVLPQ